MTSSLCVVLAAILCGSVIPQAVTLTQGGNPERTLLSDVLAKEVGLFRYYEGMSIMHEGNGMGKGKGKGKGNEGECIGHGDPKGCSKSSKKGMAKDKKDKGMGKSMKQGMSKDKDKSKFPSASIVPSQCKYYRTITLYLSIGCLITLVFSCKSTTVNYFCSVNCKPNICSSEYRKYYSTVVALHHFLSN